MAKGATRTTQARAWYQRPADQGLRAGRNNLALSMVNGRGVAKRLRQRGAWYQKARSGPRIPRSITSLALCRLGQGVAKELHPSASLAFRKPPIRATPARSLTSRAQREWPRRRKGLRPSASLVPKRRRQAMRAGRITSLIYVNGWGVAKDSPSGAWYQKRPPIRATRTRQFNSAWALTRMAEASQGYPSKPRAYVPKRRPISCNADAQVNLGVLLREWPRRPRGFIQARAWYQKAGRSGQCGRAEITSG